MTFNPEELALLAKADQSDDLEVGRFGKRRQRRKMSDLGRLTLLEALTCHRAGYTRKDLMAVAGVREWRVAQWRRDNGIARPCRRGNA